MGLSTKNEASLREESLRPVADLLKTNKEACVCVFVNFCGQARKTTSLLEDIFTAYFLQAGVLTINRDMDKHEKFVFIRLFTSVYRIDEYIFCVLVVTAAANTGIGQPLYARIVCLSLPCCPTTLLQARGCLVRKGGMHRVFTLHSYWESWIMLVVCVLATSGPFSDNVANHSYANSAIKSRPLQWQRDQAAATTAPKE